MKIIEKIFENNDFDNFSNIKRWSQKSVSRQENLAEHTHFVTLFTSFLVDCFKEDKTKLIALNYAIFHDCDELFTGDICHEVKHNEINGRDIKECLKTFFRFKITEKYYSDDDESCVFFIQNSIGNIDQKIKDVVKLADWLSMIFFLNRENKISNVLEKEYIYCLEKTIYHIDLLILIVNKKENEDFFKDNHIFLPFSSPPEFLFREVKEFLEKLLKEKEK
jgi:5'-deoxynucleotidase YfbR-like HD superfamily hydrolase